LVPRADKIPDSCAKDLEWFCEYTPFESFVTVNGLHGYGPEVHVPVLGVGTVDFPASQSWAPKVGSPNLSIIMLHNVLHVPSLPCNILAPTRDRVNGSGADLQKEKTYRKPHRVMKEYIRFANGERAGWVMTHQSAPWGNWERIVWKVRSATVPKGPFLAKSPFETGTAQFTGPVLCQWGEEERKLYFASRMDVASTSSDTSTSTDAAEPRPVRRSQSV